ncbi:MHYT domain-containing protein [Polaromonas sp. UC242_47]|uniref:MHYT domain-containing protein n=1 Tax=Polaromonas sp. UC242_47 TaxID=3374626 RepID=UPI003791B180
MNSVVVTSYQPTYVALSFLVAFFGSFVALTAATRIKLPNGKASFSNTLSAGVALGGVGVWSMHFVGMVALKLNVGVSYGLTEIVISLLAAIAATSLALAFVAQAPDHLARIVGAGTVLGLGVVFMHYLGMYGLKFNGFIEWDWGRVALSVLIAIVAATAALWLAFKTPTLPIRAAAAIIMAVAVCAMHYTGMGAAEFICTTTNLTAIPQGAGYISSFKLGGWVTIGALSMAFIIFLDQFFQESSGKPLLKAAVPK